MFGRNESSVSRAAQREAKNSLCRTVHPGWSSSPLVLGTALTLSLHLAISSLQSRQEQTTAGGSVSDSVSTCRSQVKVVGVGGKLQPDELSVPGNGCSNHFGNYSPASAWSLVSVPTKLATEGGSPLQSRGTACSSPPTDTHSARGGLRKAELS